MLGLLKKFSISFETKTSGYYHNHSKVHQWHFKKCYNSKFFWKRASRKKLPLSTKKTDFSTSIKNVSLKSRENWFSTTVQIKGSKFFAVLLENNLANASQMIPVQTLQSPIFAKFSKKTLSNETVPWKRLMGG